jgi:Zn-dependent protease
MSDSVYLLMIAVPILLVSVSLHEMMHALTSYLLGDDTAYSQGRVSVNPLRHIDPFLTLALPLMLILAHLPPFGAAKPVQVNFHRVRYGEFGAAIIGAAGPLTNLFLALIGVFLLKGLNPMPGVLYDVLGYTIIINLGLGIFNSIPWPPLDGSRVLYAFAPRPLQEIMEGIERTGMMGLVIFMLLFYQFIGPLVGNLIDKLTNGLLT